LVGIVGLPAALGLLEVIGFVYIPFIFVLG
jgi:hypothetical protein